MSAGTAAPPQHGPAQPAPWQPAAPGRDGFAQVVHAEWTKFRTVRGWVIGMVVAALLTVLIGLLAAGGAQIGCVKQPGDQQLSGKACLPVIPVGPDGQPVSDSYYFVHQPVTADGSITVRVTSLTGEVAAGGGGGGATHVPAPGQGQGPDLAPGLVPWAKAGIMVTASTRPGAAYAAMLVTGAHGVRMQYDYAHDIAGLPGSVSPARPRWLRLTRSGNTVSGYDSADGRHWSLVGTASLAGLPGTAQAGLFATSPQDIHITQGFGVSSEAVGPSQATGTFARVRLVGGAPGTAWAGTAVSRQNAPLPGGFTRDGGQFTVTGSGDIAPFDPGQGYPAAPIESHLAGAFAGLIVIVVIGAMFITAEYRRGLIWLTLAASPRRGRMLAAKALVVAGVTFVMGLVAAVIAVVIGTRIAHDQGIYVLPVSLLTEVRVIAGTAALLAVAGVLAVAVGALARRSAVAITAVIVGIVVPYILAVASLLPATAADWLLRVTPAAGFAIQQSQRAWPQITESYTPSGGYFPLPPWAGFAVLCGYAALIMALAIRALQRRDA
jgi:hypothetical protein